jgi:hypothetical protein
MRELKTALYNTWAALGQPGSGRVNGWSLVELKPLAQSPRSHSFLQILRCDPRLAMANQRLSTVERRVTTIPESYIRPESDRPRLAEVTADNNMLD